MASSMPDVINASLGAAFGGVVGPIIDNLVEGLKFVYHCRDECTALGEALKRIQPSLKNITSHKDSTMKQWLDAFGKCVEEAEAVLKQCGNESWSIWNEIEKVKYGGKIVKLRERIKELVSEASLVLLAPQSSRGIEQELPAKILGMDGHFQRVKWLITEGHKSKGSSCVGIRGMGGAGKTLLAKMVNNDEEIRRTFGEESIMWITVGRDAQISVIYERMRKCLQVSSHGGSLEDQRTELRNAFLKRSVLLILDDVWDGIVHEYKEMVEWLDIATGCGSVTLVTTRDESITRKCVNAGEEIILRLSKEQTWELFCIHAFGTDVVQSLNKDLEEVAMDVCQECKCLPLALKVIGRVMKGKHDDIYEWRKMLRRLQGSSVVDKGVEQELFKRLQISYDELHDVAKICFLYFAAFPEDCEIPVIHLCGLWVAEGLFGEGHGGEEAWDEAYCALNELLQRSLIEVCNVDGSWKVQCVRMHDILRDLAIQLTREGKECERESLFEMKKKDIEEFPKSWLGSTMKVKRLSLWGNKLKRFPNNFKAPNLEICMLHPEPWEVLFKDVESTCQECIIGGDFFKNLEALKCLQICANSTIYQLPESVGSLGSLQHLDLRGCGALQELPKNIGGLGSLQHLNLGNCGTLQQLPDSIGGLESLQHLDLASCKALQQLPKNMGGMRSLQHLDLSWCGALQQLPESIGRLESLQHFNLKGCRALQQLPESIGKLGSLQHLNLESCEALQQLPESMERLRSLQHLNLKYCRVLQKLPQNMGGLESLQHLDFSWCGLLQQLPESMGGLRSLHHLNLEYCKGFQQLPKSMGNLKFLQYLNLERCRALHELPNSMGGLGSLQYLNLRGCGALQQLPESMGELKSIQYLDLSKCTILQQLPKSFVGLRSLQHLNLRCCRVLQQLPENIEGLESLQHLNLESCKALQQFPQNMGELRSLEYLNLTNCIGLKELPKFEKISRLQIMY